MAATTATVTTRRGVGVGAVTLRHEHFNYECIDKVTLGFD